MNAKNIVLRISYIKKTILCHTVVTSKKNFAINKLKTNSRLRGHVGVLSKCPIPFQMS